jgi:hypothetical protein
MIPKSVTADGEATLVEIELDGRWRQVSVDRKAIEHYLRLSPEETEEMSADQRLDFVRSNLAYVLAAVRKQVEANPDARHMYLSSGDL